MVRHRSYMEPIRIKLRECAMDYWSMESNRHGRVSGRLFLSSNQILRFLLSANSVFG